MIRRFFQTLIDGREPVDPATDTRLKAMEANGTDYAAFKVATNAALAFARTKWAGERLVTDASGVRVINVPAGLMKAGLSILGPIVRGGGGLYTADASVTGTPETGYAVTISFMRRKSKVTVPAVVLGAAAVELSLNEAVAGVVTFDIGFAEPDVIGG